MSFESDLRSRLVTDPTVSSLVGTRVYWKIRPQDSALPAVVLGMVYGARDQGMAGPMGTQGNRIQIDCMADQRAGVGAKERAVTLREAVQGVIERAGSHGATNFQGGFVSLYRDTAEDTASGAVHTEMIDATIWFN